MSEDDDKGEKDDKNLETLTKSIEALTKKVDALSDENATLRKAKDEIVTDRDTLKTKLKDIDDKKITESGDVEAVKKLLEDSESKNQSLEAERKKDLINFDLKSKLSAAGVKNLDAALKLIDQASISVVDGQVHGADKLVTGFVEEFPAFAKKPPADPDLGPAPTTFEGLNLNPTEAEKAAMSPKEMVDLQIARGKAHDIANKDKLPGMTLK